MQISMQCDGRADSRDNLKVGKTAYLCGVYRGYFWFSIPEINLIVAPPVMFNTCWPDMENGLPNNPSDNYSSVLSNINSTENPMELHKEQRQSKYSIHRAKFSNLHSKKDSW